MVRTGRENLLTFIYLGFIVLITLPFIYFYGEIEILKYPLVIGIWMLIFCYTGCQLFGYNDMLVGFVGGGSKSLILEPNKCPNCRADVLPTDNFCGNCSTLLTNEKTRAS